MSDFAPRVVALLLTSGSSFVRHGKGDRDTWFSPITNVRFVVDAKMKSRHLANGVLKQAGLPKVF